MTNREHLRENLKTRILRHLEAASTWPVEGDGILRHSAPDPQRCCFCKGHAESTFRYDRFSDADCAVLLAAMRRSHYERAQ